MQRPPPQPLLGTPSGLTCEGEARLAEALGSGLGLHAVLGTGGGGTPLGRAEET